MNKIILFMLTILNLTFYAYHLYNNHYILAIVSYVGYFAGLVALITLSDDFKEMRK